MIARNETGPTPGDFLTEAASLLGGLGMLTLVLFPFALPAIALAAVAVVPLLVVAVVAAGVAAVTVPPTLAVRAVRRRHNARRKGAVNPDPAAARASLSAAPSARAARP